VARANARLVRRLRLTSLRIRLIAVFVLVALTAALAVSGIAYWLNRDAVLKRAQNSTLSDFRSALSRDSDQLPLHPSCAQLQNMADAMAASGLQYDVLLVEGSCSVTSNPSYTVGMLPAQLRAEVQRPTASATLPDKWDYHLFWQRVSWDGHPYLVGGTQVVPIGTGPTGYLVKSLDDERKDLDSLAWSLGIATLLALIAAALLAQASSATVLRPVGRLGEAARRLGEGHLETRLEVSGADELAELSQTFNNAAEALQAQVEELSARERASRRFVADMSHELRTPLTAMTAVSDILEDEADMLDPMVEPAVRLVVAETRRLSDLVENLMEVTRFDAGTARLVLDDVDVADLITSCIDTRAWLDAVDVDAPRGIVARVDPRRIDVVLANLIGNALKHGGSPVRVRVWTEGPETDGGPQTPSAETAQATRAADATATAERPAAASPSAEESEPPAAARAEPVPFSGTASASAAPSAPASAPVSAPGGEQAADPRIGRTLVVEVTDSGPGIPEDVLPHVFDRFFKADTARPRSEGSGLGLSIAHENVRIHGGTVTAGNSAAAGLGAVFTVRLPLAPAEEPDEPTARPVRGDRPGGPAR